MATIQKRQRKDGSTAYRAIIRIHEGKEVVHTESSTFTKKKDAILWAARREIELEEGGVPDPNVDDGKVTVKRLIEKYEEVMKEIKPYGRSKDQVLRKWKKRPEGETFASDVDASWIIDFARMRRVEENAGPATVNSDIVHLRGIFAVAKHLLKVDVTAAPFDEARPNLRKLNLASKGGERDRRPELDEITKIVEYAHSKKKSPYYRKTEPPMDKIIVFQMFSGRRISETCRLKVENLDRKKQMVLVEDMKDPQNKKGNDIWCFVPDEAWAILLNVVDSMDNCKPTDRIFPYNEKSVTANFRRYRDRLGLSYLDDDSLNLKVHDLRHECLSWLAEKNGLSGEHWDLPRIQLVSGHEGWNVLQRYVNLLTEKPLDKWKDWVWKTKVLD